MEQEIVRSTKQTNKYFILTSKPEYTNYLNKRKALSGGKEESPREGRKHGMQHKNTTYSFLSQAPSEKCNLYAIF
jgi:hypothetical protein